MKAVDRSPPGGSFDEVSFHPSQRLLSRNFAGCYDQQFGIATLD